MSRAALTIARRGVASAASGSGGALFARLTKMRRRRRWKLPAFVLNVQSVPSLRVSLPMPTQSVAPLLKLLTEKSVCRAPWLCTWTQP